jgi:hypothetical protein
MQRRQRTKGLVTIGGVLCILALSMGVQGTTWGAIGSFAPPSNVVAEVSPELYKYEIQRIGIISFVNHSGTPDAGVRLASFFHAELGSHQRFELPPPLLLDEETELAFTRTAQAIPED